MLGKKTGGRQKGTPNKATSAIKTAISGLINEYVDSGGLSEDFALLEPRERIAVVEKLAQYIVPKMKSVEMELSSGDNTNSLEETLKELGASS